MAIINTLPDQAVIDGLRGILDFYCYGNLAVVRSWPRTPFLPRSPSVIAAQGPFGYISHLTPTVSPSIRLAFVEMASGSRYTWKDLLIKSYIKGVTYD